MLSSIHLEILKNLHDLYIRRSNIPADIEYLSRKIGVSEREIELPIEYLVDSGFITKEGLELNSYIWYCFNITVKGIDILKSPEYLIKILFLASNPSDLIQMKLGQEIRNINETLRNTKFRDKFRIEQCHAVRPEDLSGILLEHNPHILHFSNYGTADGNIILEDDDSNSVPVALKSIGNLLGILKDNLRCVVLNRCFYTNYASEIAKHIDCVCGTISGINDAKAILFSQGLYRGVGYGKSLAVAFEIGRTQMGIYASDDKGECQMINKPGVDPSTISLIKA
jgi:hypothetical protein